jgi:hypothetical protein
MSVLEVIWIGVLAILLAVYINHFQHISASEHASLLIAIGLASFMYSYRRKLRRNRSKTSD